MSTRLKVIGTSAIPVDDIERAYIIKKTKDKQCILFGPRTTYYYIRIKLKGKFWPIDVYVKGDANDAMNELKKVVPP